ncbi:ShlB/FhaC/HecB family hemolysin secretion/activation protein [Ramlibacter humi]|uniref:ShlB/FhaC/HecB family hemolysin secretion/activation protein n=1 Tax=Ramlibacter humi TaxID=2530451 RepID=A0A4Z0CD96_9BURK|nr:ShlB/FhaC/HecB family hemolysin secretion/activation protein [Ramlibacter humi]TFZ08149.1 ShlB/FhaC/HecB family hemolysin secretion/activation protein [Ramlibacter humi]
MNKKSWVAVAAATLCSTVPTFAQQIRPDAGTLLEQPSQLPALPAPGGAPTTVVPQAPAAAPFASSVRMTPAAFRIQGNTLFKEEELRPLVAEFVGKETDMEGLVKAANAVRRYYRDRGYLLTEAYLPEQQFAATGGTVTIQVLEARVGKVSVKVEDEGISQSLASAIVNTHLKAGDYISEKSLDKPVLLLRDLIGFEATAAVEPGANNGEADITVVVKSAGPKADGLVGVDNSGVRSAGQTRAFASANLNNPTGRGDVLSVRVQESERSASQLYRVGYSTAVGGYATKLGLNATRTEYALGKQFAALGATGEATIYGASLTQPFIRSRVNNLLGAITYEHKELTDRTTTPPSTAERKVDTVRLSALGNFVDEALGASFNSYGVHYTSGHLREDAATLALDQGATGLRTAGHFSKINLEYLRTTFVSAAGRVSLSFQGQFANKNLTSAEKIGLGGPNGVRGYPSGEAVGDSGTIVQLEYSHQLPETFGIPLRASAFYDWGRVKYNEGAIPAAFGAITNSESLSSVGIGLTAGTFGNWLVSTQLAWRLNRAPGTDPDKHPRVWLSLQKWL